MGPPTVSVALAPQLLALSPTSSLSASPVSCVTSPLDEEPLTAENVGLAAVRGLIQELVEERVSLVIEKVSHNMKGLSETARADDHTSTCATGGIKGLNLSMGP